MYGLAKLAEDRHNHAIPYTVEGLAGAPTKTTKLIPFVQDHHDQPADKGTNYHPLMQGEAKHWAETGQGFHTRKS